MLNRAEEDYIKTIYELTIQKKIDIVKTNEIADTFSYTDQSVNEMVKKLVQKKLVKFIPYKGVHLTKNGINEAIRLIRAHRIWEVFLTEKLGYDWEDVHEDAEKLEHVSSKNLISKLEELLNYPKYCQHGNPIPNEKGDISTFSNISIDELMENDQFIVTRVLDQKELLIFLNEQNIQINQTYRLIKSDKFNNIFMITDVHEHHIYLSMKVAKMIFVKQV